MNTSPVPSLPSLPTRRDFLNRIGHGPRRHRAGRDARLAPRARRRTTARSGSRIFRRRRSASSISSCPAGLRSSISSITSRCSISATASNSPTPSAAAQRLTGMSGNQASIPLVGSPFKFAQHGQAGAWFSELLPHTAAIADDLCVVRSMFTEAINHGPGVTFLQTGSQIPGRPSIGAWLSYGLGQENANLPSFVVLITKDKGGQPLGSHLWGSGFLAEQTPGRALSRGEGSRALSRQPGRRQPRRAGGCCSIGCANCTSISSKARPTRKFRAGSTNTRWRFACRRASRR